LLCTRFLGDYEYILLDVGGGLGDAFSAATEVANRFYILATPDPVSLRGARLVAEMLQELPAELRLVLNRVDPQLLQAEGVLYDLDEAVDTVGVRLLGVVPESGVIRAVAETGGALPGHSTEHKVFTAIARRVLGSEVPLVVQ
jgi:septum site-determining protein MinD